MNIVHTRTQRAGGAARGGGGGAAQAVLVCRTLHLASAEEGGEGAEGDAELALCLT